MYSRLLLAATLAIGSAAWCADDAVEQAVSQLREGHLEEALGTLRAAISRDPASSRANYLLAETLLAKEEVDEADEAIQKAVALSPGSASLLQAQGDVDFRKGDILKAEADYKAAYHIDPKNARAIYGIARIFQCAALNKKAALLFRQAHDLDPHDAAILSSFAAVSAKDDEELTAFQTALSAARGEERRRLQWAQARIARRKVLNGRRSWILKSPYEPAEVPLNKLTNGPTRVYGFGISVGINGANPAILQLDTGASGVVLNRRLAEKAGVQKIAEMDLAGLGDQADPTGYIGFAEHVKIGDIEFENCIVHVSDKKALVDAEGLIGTDIFERFLVTIDFGRHKVQFGRLPGPVWDGSTPVDRYAGPELKGFAQFYRVGHDILVPTRISAGEPKLFLVDTGSTANLISADAARAVTKVHDDSRMRFKGISGAVKNVYSADKVELQFAGFRQTNLDLVSFDISGVSRGAGIEISGIMGIQLLTLFNSLTIDYRDGMIRFDYKAR